MLRLKPPELLQARRGVRPLSPALMDRLHEGAGLGVNQVLSTSGAAPNQDAISLMLQVGEPSREALYVRAEQQVHRPHIRGPRGARVAQADHLTLRHPWWGLQERHDSRVICAERRGLTLREPLSALRCGDVQSVGQHRSIDGRTPMEG